jgi:sugar phosphate isomerase/epimerase
LHTAAQTGCNGVQIDARHELRPTDLSDTGLRQFRKILDDLNLRVGSIAFPTRRGYANPEGLERRLEAAQAAMQLASRLQAGILVVNLGSVPDAESAPERSLLVEALLSLASRGNQLGVQLAAQASGTDVDVLKAFIETLPEGTLSLDLHPVQLIGQEESPANFIAAVGRHIVHVHAVDAVRDIGSGGSVEVELGRGAVDFPELLGMLEEFGFRGWFTIERRDSQQVVEDVTNAVRFLRSL